jgi:hypothetical protein
MLNLPDDWDSGEIAIGMIRRLIRSGFYSEDTDHDLTAEERVLLALIDLADDE